MKTNFVLAGFGLTFGTLRFDEKTFQITLFGFTPYWDYKPTNVIHADSPGVYTSEKFLNSNTIDKINLKYDIIDDSVLSGLRQPILYSFGLDKPPGYKLEAKF